MDDKCNIYDYATYFRISMKTMPKILSDLFQRGYKFYVKGGLAIDKYLKKEVMSPDWDILLDGNIKNQDIGYIYYYIYNKLQEYHPDINFVQNYTKFRKRSDPQNPLSGSNIPLYQIGFQQRAECAPMYFIDLNYDKEKKISDNEITVMDGIPYQSLSEVQKDLEITFRNRKILQEEILTKIGYNPEYYLINHNLIIKNIQKDSNKIYKYLKGEIKNINLEQEKRIKINGSLKLLVDNLNYLVSLAKTNYIQKLQLDLKRINFISNKRDLTEQRLDYLNDAINNPNKLSSSYLNNICNSCSNNKNQNIKLSQNKTLQCSDVLNNYCS